VGLVDSTTLPLPVVAHGTIWPLEFVQFAGDPAGTAPPLILPTVVALCVPVTSPLKLPVKLVALVAFATAVDPIALTICVPVAVVGADPVEK
jgi:hypothetical protein